MNTPAELDVAARRAVLDCLRVSAGERFLVVFERDLAGLADAMMRAALKAGATVETIELRGESLDRGLTRAIEGCDVSAFVASFGADITVRRAMVQHAPSRRRHAHLIGVNELVIRQSLTVDPRESEAFGRRLIARMRPSSTLRVESPTGTSLTVELDPRHRWHNEHGILTRPGWTNLPAGEVMTSPGNVEGVFVPDGGVWLSDGTSLDRVAAKRMRIRMVGGRVLDAEGEDAAVRALLGHLDTGIEGRRVGQVCFGTNTAVVAPIGVACQDVKLRGFHLILGYSAPELTGASWNGTRVVQLLQRRASVTIDGTPVLVEGRYVLPD